MISISLLRCSNLLSIFIYLDAIRRKIELDTHTGDEVYLEHIRRYVRQLYSNSVQNGLFH